MLGHVLLALGLILVQETWKKVEKRARNRDLQVFRRQRRRRGLIGEGDGIFLTPLTVSVRFNGIFRQFNGIFLTASVDTVSVHGTWPRVGGA